MEEYRKVDGYDYYLVSDLGNVKTVDRVVKTKAKMSNSAINRKRNKEGKFICQ